VIGLTNVPALATVVERQDKNLPMKKPNPAFRFYRLVLPLQFQDALTDPNTQETF
jgi:hypothetical protein